MGWTCRSLLINCPFSGPACITKMDLPEPLLRTAQALQNKLLKTGVRVTVVKLWVIKSKQCAQWDLKDLKIILWPFLKQPTWMKKKALTYLSKYPPKPSQSRPVTAPQLWGTTWKPFYWHLKPFGKKARQKTSNCPNTNLSQIKTELEIVVTKHLL